MTTANAALTSPLSERAAASETVEMQLLPVQGTLREGWRAGGVLQKTPRPGAPQPRPLRARPRLSLRLYDPNVRSHLNYHNLCESRPQLRAPSHGSRRHPLPSTQFAL